MYNRQSFTQNLQEFPSLPSCPCALKVAVKLGVAVVVRLLSEHQLKYHLPGGPSFTRVGWIIGLEQVVSVWSGFWIIWRTRYMRLSPSFLALSCCVLECGGIRLSTTDTFHHLHHPFIKASSTFRFFLYMCAHLIWPSPTHQFLSTSY